MQLTSRRTEILIQLAFWLMMFSFSMNVVTQLLDTTPAIIESIKTVSLLMIAAYLNANFIIPKYFRSGRFGLYGLAIFLLIFSFMSINYFLPDLMQDAINQKIPEIKVDLPLHIPRHRVRFIPLFFMLITILFISTVYRLGKEFLLRDRQALKLERERVAYELNFLKSQINPHFLFNALNNLGATVYLYPERAESFIQKLGEMLRYMLEDGQHPEVPLSQEIIYLENYLWFQRQKGKEFGRVIFEMQGGDSTNVFIAPMLLIILVENAFVHGYQEDDRRQSVDIKLSWTSEQLQFTVNNTMPTTEERNESKRNGGLGLVNLRRRLELIYPNNYLLDTQLRADSHYAHLQLNLTTP